MFHMLTCFDLKPDITIEEFGQSVKTYEQHMQENQLVQSMGPIGERKSDTIMDTDNERDHQYFFISTFSDRAQCDEAVAYILGHEEPGDSIHKEVYSKVENQIFVCWQDIKF